tara:strand:- start:7414 stop:7569 length:156 start_codon:yes stop_codon:yes gene_type:complete
LEEIKGVGNYDKEGLRTNGSGDEKSQRIKQKSNKGDNGIVDRTFKEGQPEV